MPTDCLKAGNDWERPGSSWRCSRDGDERSVRSQYNRSAGDGHAKRLLDDPFPPAAKTVALWRWAFPPFSGIFPRSLEASPPLVPTVPRSRWAIPPRRGPFPPSVWAVPPLRWALPPIPEISPPSPLGLSPHGVDSAVRVAASRSGFGALPGSVRRGLWKIWELPSGCLRSPRPVSSSRFDKCQVSGRDLGPMSESECRAPPRWLNPPRDSRSARRSPSPPGRRARWPFST